jgi:hypothetical protein
VRRLKSFTLLLLVSTIVLSGIVADGQTIRFANHRDIGPPEYAALRVGPFYSSVTFSQSIGVWWTEGRGAGTDFLYGARRGRVRKDGWDIPLIAELSTRNYIILGRHTDLDISIYAGYYYYPLDTQENEFYLNVAEPGISAEFAFTSEFYLTPNIRGSLYFTPTIVVDFVDDRGQIDETGGRRFFHLDSIAGVSLDWLAGKDLNIGADFRRMDLVSFEDEFDDQEFTEYNATLSTERGFFDLFLVGVRGSARDVDYEDTGRDDTRFYTAELYYSGHHREALGIPLGDDATLGASIGYSVADRTRLADSGSIDFDAGADHRLIWSLTIDYGKMARTENNFMHKFGLNRTHTGGFNADVLVEDTAEYTLTWYTGPLDIGFSSRFINAEPQDDDVNAYWDWATTLGVTYHLARFWSIDLNTTYSIRDNEAYLGEGEDDAPPDLTDDYNTWTTILRTSYNFTEHWSCTAFASHVERRADSDDFTYERSTAGTTLVYTRSF